MENELSQRLLQEQMLLLDSFGQLLDLVSAGALCLLALLAIFGAGSTYAERRRQRHARQLQPQTRGRLRSSHAAPAFVGRLAKKFTSA